MPLSFHVDCLACVLVQQLVNLHVTQVSTARQNFIRYMKASLHEYLKGAYGSLVPY